MPFRIFHATCHSESYPHRDIVTRNWQHCLLSCFRIIRAPDRDLFHQFHEKKCDPKLTKDQYRSCLGSKAVAEGTHTQIAIQLTKLREKYESESQENGFSEWKKKTARGTWHGRSWAREKTNEMQGWMKAQRKIKMDTILELGSAFNWWNIYTTIRQYCFKHKPVNRDTFPIRNRLLRWHHRSHQESWKFRNIAFVVTRRGVQILIDFSIRMERFF